MSQTWILHADMDAFFASVEQRDYVGYQGIPLIVGSKKERRGVVAAASYEAREYGVYSSMPIYMAKQLCPYAVFIPCNIEKYREVSIQIHSVFKQFTDKIQPVALDEAYLDVTEKMKEYSDPIELGQQIKIMVKELVNLNISVGIGPNKTIAKLVCSESKPNGLGVVRPEEVVSFLNPLPIRKLSGVGPVTEVKLKEFGIETLGDIAKTDPEKLKRIVGNRAPDLQIRAKGEEVGEVEIDRTRKSYNRNHTFQYDTNSREEILDVIRTQVNDISKKLKKSNLLCKSVTLRVKFSERKNKETPTRLGYNVMPHENKSHVKALKSYTDDPNVIYEMAQLIWDELASFEMVKLIGVRVSQLKTEDDEDPPPKALDSPPPFNFFG